MRVRGSERVSNVEMDLYVGREEHNSSPLTVYPMSTISVQTTSNERGNACFGILNSRQQSMRHYGRHERFGCLPNAMYVTRLF